MVTGPWIHPWGGRTIPADPEGSRDRAWAVFLTMALATICGYVFWVALMIALYLQALVPAGIACGALLAALLVTCRVKWWAGLGSLLAGLLAIVVQATVSHFVYVLPIAHAALLCLVLGPWCIITVRINVLRSALRPPQDPPGDHTDGRMTSLQGPSTSR